MYAPLPLPDSLFAGGSQVLSCVSFPCCRRSSDLPPCTFGCGQVPSLSGSVATATFSAWNDKRSQLTAQGVKLSGIGASVAQDLEPECVTFSEDERLAFVSLQVGAVCWRSLVLGAVGVPAS
jgi:hypothetical protein